MCDLQMRDKGCKDLVLKFLHGQIKDTGYCILDGLLCRQIAESNQTFTPVYLPECLIDPVLILAHDNAGHNGFQRTYAAIRRLYYWKGMKKQILRHCLDCSVCQHFRKERIHLESEHFRPGLAPMEFVSMDLIGEFHPPSSKGNRYALTVICMLTGYTFCIPIPDKKAETVVKAYVDNVYTQFGGSRKILSDNGTEFKNQLFDKIADKIGVEQKIYTPAYRPQSNGRIEGFHRFLKLCISKHISNQLEWDDVAPLATAAYNFFPNQSSKESAFFAMFGRDPLVPLNKMLEKQTRYLGNEDGLMNLQALQNMYEVTAQQLKYARDRASKPGPKKDPPEIKSGQLVLVKNHTAHGFQPKFKALRVVDRLGKNQYRVKDCSGRITTVHRTHVKPYTERDRVADAVVSQEAFGRRAKLRIDHTKIPDLMWIFNPDTTPDHLQEPTTEVQEATERSCTTGARPDFGTLLSALAERQQTLFK